MFMETVGILRLMVYIEFNIRESMDVLDFEGVYK